MARAKGRGRGRGSRGGRGRGRGRTKKMVIDSGSEEEQEQMDTSDNGETQATEEEEVSTVDDVEESTTIELNKDNSVEFNIDDDISQLVPPTFSTISKGPPQPMLELNWDFNYANLGEKVASPNIHMCIACRLPIRLYGRLIPCKHVFCYTCAVKQGDRCSCCDDRVTRIEKAPLGSVYMCLHGGIQYGYEGCRRTYLSQRDLQAHFNHRHKPRSGSASGGGGGSSSIHDAHSPGSHRQSSSSALTSTPSSSHHQTIQYARPNLISVPLQSVSAGTPSSRSSSKDTHPDRFDRKSNSSYSRSNTSGWGSSSSFRPY